MKKVVLLILTALTTLPGWAQDATTVKSFWEDPVGDPLFPVYVVTAFVFIVIAMVAFVAVYLIRILNMLAATAEEERARQQGIPYVPRPSWWDRFVQQVNDSVPVEQEEAIELDHNYDGIRELDNHLPPWWKWLFIGTIVWAAVYIFVYHFSYSLPLQEEEYQREVSVAAEEVRKFRASQPQAVVDEEALEYTADPEIIGRGRTVFVNNACGSCHRDDGGGNTIGPNLTDAYWIHGGDIKQVFQTIKNGVVEKGMPAWGKTMSIQNVLEVTYYVMSLTGTNPPDGKAPQGELYQPEPAKMDTTAVEVEATLVP